jgi:inner membrane protein
VTAPTHVSFATLIYFALLTSAGVALNLWNGLAIALASLLPDVDTGASVAGRLFPFLSRRIERRFGHRTLTHSLPFTAALAVCLAPLALFDRDLYFLLLVGYVSHPLLDSCTVTGVRLLYPISNARCVFPMDVNVPTRYRIATGGGQERVLLAILLLLCIPAFLMAHQGFARFIRVAQGNIESAVRDFRDFSRSNLVWVECRAHKPLSKETLAGRFEVAGDLDAQTLLVKTPDGELHTLGKEYRAEYVAEHAVCEKGEPASTFVERVDMTGRRVNELPVSGAGEIHLFGSLHIAGEASVPEFHAEFSPVTATGKEIRLNYATPRDLSGQGVDGYQVESGWITIRRIVVRGGCEPETIRLPAEVHDAIELHSEDELLFSCSVGDTLASGDLMAAWEEKGAVKRELQQTELALDALRAAIDEQARDLAVKSERLQSRVRADSLSHRNARRLQAQGLIAAAAVGRIASALEKDLEEIRSLALERKAMDAEHVRKAHSLLDRQSSLRSRMIPGVQRKELRARSAGVVVRLERGEKGLRYSIRKP